MIEFSNPKKTSNGKLVSDNFEQWFGKSVVVDQFGEPKKVFHSTFGDFDSFSKTHDLGYHFGSAKIAQNRLEESSIGRPRGEARQEGFNLIAAHLSISSPLRLDEDPMGWQPIRLLKLIGDKIPLEAQKKIREMDIECVNSFISQVNDLRKNGGPGVYKKFDKWNKAGFTVQLRNHTWSRLLSAHREPLYAQMRKDIQKAGFDGLSYINEFEGEGRGITGRRTNPDNLTWVAFEANQIKSAIGNSGLYLKDSASMTDFQADQELRLAARARACIPSRPLKTLKSLEVHT